jgi:hypothetical protein
MADPDRNQDPVRELDVSRALEEARKRRIELHEVLIRLEKVISSPARGRAQDWAAVVAKTLTALGAAFDYHIEATERPGGLYEEILENSPRFAGQVRRLQDEHPVIHAAIGSELDRLSSPVGDDAQVDDLRDDLQRLMGQVVRHRQRGADLVWEAYNLDIGGAE